MDQAMNMISDAVAGNYNDIFALIGLSCAAAFCLYFYSDLRQAGRRARSGRRYR